MSTKSVCAQAQASAGRSVAEKEGVGACLKQLVRKVVDLVKGLLRTLSCGLFFPAESSPGEARKGQEPSKITSRPIEQEISDAPPSETGLTKGKESAADRRYLSLFLKPVLSRSEGEIGEISEDSPLVQLLWDQRSAFSFIKSDVFYYFYFALFLEPEPAAQLILFLVNTGRIQFTLIEQSLGVSPLFIPMQELDFLLVDGKILPPDRLVDQFRAGFVTDWQRFVKEHYGKTAKGHLMEWRRAVCRVLIDKGASALFTDDQGMAPLCYVPAEDPDLVEMLAKANPAALEIKSFDGETRRLLLLKDAVFEGDKDRFERFLELFSRYGRGVTPEEIEDLMQTFLNCRGLYPSDCEMVDVLLNGLDSVDQVKGSMQRFADRCAVAQQQGWFVEQEEKASLDKVLKTLAERHHIVPDEEGVKKEMNEHQEGSGGGSFGGSVFFG